MKKTRLAILGGMLLSGIVISITSTAAQTPRDPSGINREGISQLLRDLDIQDAHRLTNEAIALEKQGRVLEAQQKYEEIIATLRGKGNYYEVALISATAYLDAARMRIEGAKRYGSSIDREANLKAIFENLAQVEPTVQGGMQNAPLTGPFFGARNLLLARLHFVRGNLDQSAVEIQESLRMFRNFQKYSVHKDPQTAQIISFIEGVERQVRNSPLSRNNLVETAKSLSKLVPSIGAFLPEVITFVDEYQRAKKVPPRL